MRVHRFLRGLFGWYPVKFGAAWVNRRLDRLFEGGEPKWLLAPGRGLWPTMELDVSTNLQRKFFYFPRAYGRFYGSGKFRTFLERTLEPGTTFLDIGANVGFFSLLAARLVGPTGRVYAFEPEPNICEALSRSARANGYAHVTAFQLALSDDDGELAFYRARDGTASSLVPEAPGREARYQHTLVTKVTTLDKLVERGEVDMTNVRLVKVDVEGAEPRTVAGMRATLSTSSPAVWCEVRGPQGSTRAPNTYPVVRDFFAELGYRPFQWVDGSRIPVRDGDIVERADVLFERA